jgi:DNA-binding transcriptional regulator YiaG
MKTFTAEEVKALREKLGLSKIKFATVIGLSSYKQVSRIEQGDGAITMQTTIILNYLENFGLLKTD